MQSFLNYFLYTVVFVYATLFVMQFYFQVKQGITSPLESNKGSTEIVVTETKISAAEPLITTVKTSRYLVNNPAQEEYEKVTVKQMKKYITEKQLKLKLEQVMNCKLYKARKQDLYNALRAI